MLRKRTSELASYALSVGVRQAAKYFGLEPSTIRREVRKFKEFHKFNKYGKTREPKALLLDIETAPMIAYIWSLKVPGGYINPDSLIEPWFTICWSAKWLCQGETFNACVTSKEALKRDDSRIIKEAWALLDEADVVIMHNGNSFDRRRLNNRFIKYGLMPPSPYTVIDTLHVSRKEFDFPSHKQGWVSRYLEIPQKLETNFGLWVNCVQGNQKALEEMAIYCNRDVGGLEELYLKFRPWMKSHPNMALYGEMIGEKKCHRCGSEDLEWGYEYATPMNIYDAARCNKCHGFTRMSKTALSKTERKTLTRSIAH